MLKHHELVSQNKCYIRYKNFCYKTFISVAIIIKNGIWRRKSMDKKFVIGILIIVLCATVLPGAGQPTKKAGVEQQNVQSSTSGRGPIDSWPMFRYEPGNTGYTTSRSPEMDHLVWKHQISSGNFGSTPILSGNKLYMSTGWYYKQRSKTLDLTTHPLSAIEFLQDLLKNQHDVTSGVFCLDAKTGAQLWTHPMFAPLDPAVINDKLYLTDMASYSDYSILYCLDTQTGNTVWQKQIDQVVLSPTIVADNKIYLGCLDLYSYQGSFKCYDLNGNFLWNYILQPYEAIWFSAPAVSGGYVYFFTFNMYEGGGRLCCLNAATGQFIWSKSIFSVIPYYYFYQEISPACANGKVYAIDLNFYSYTGYLKCFNGATGSLIWSYPFGSAVPISTPAVTDDSIFLLASYFSTPTGFLYAINSENGTLRWTFPLSGSSYMLFGSPVCSSEKVILAPQLTKSLACFDQQTGTLDWEYMLDNETLGFPAISNGWIYIPDYMGNIYAFEDAVQIESVSGGFLGVHAKIQNIGNSTATNVTWGITVVGGALGFIDRSKGGTIQAIQLGESTTVRVMPIIGMGKVDITVSIHMPNTNTIKVVKHGLVLGFMTFITS